MTRETDDKLKGFAQRLEPSRIRRTLMHASLMQLVHEMIKQWVVDDVKAFYGYDNLISKGLWLTDQSKDRYEREVLSLAPGKIFEASELWLERSNAITADQRTRLSEIFAYRHALTHEVVGFVIDMEKQLDDALLTDALEIARCLDRFWIQVEKDMGTYDAHGDVDIDDVASGRALVLQLFVGAYLSSDQPEGNG